ncbi:sensor histidine kinase [Aliicoccus persicus]|uniref:histidine kinase n=1 Tax=Aliicoccus persicus TaxID=930138 RepID=A0A662Z3Q0_9STAP|nr:HAMP domain-containing sensor histidine kinase [Aliicoccus persicus]SEW01694.1 Signal transduction histidine kinase [Aliicoccus persicus]
MGMLEIFIGILISSLLFNGLFIFKEMIQKKQNKRTTTHLKKIIEGKSNSALSISGQSKSHDELIIEVNRLVKKLNEISFQYEKMIEENKRMVSSISHDFRTPLTSMLGYIQIVKKDAFTLNEENYLGIIEERTRTLNSLVEDFYMLSLLDSKEYSVSLQRVNPVLVLQEQLALYYEELDKIFDSIDIHIEETPIYIHTSQNDLKRIIGNLIKNAFQHGVGSFSVYSEKKEGYISFHFENEAENLSAIDEERLFERLYRADESRTSGSSGLGLSIAQKLAERLRMKLSVKTMDNKIHFTLQIPVED